ncbi:MAG: helix-turn-helix domain-containing protein [Candidatus Dormiibacterota bacterium]
MASSLSIETSIIYEITVDPLELILHPVRLRIIHAMGGGRVHTTSELCHRLTGISKATVYRQVALLADNGVLEVVDERRVHGAMERRYRLSTSRAVTDPSVATNVPLDDHRKEFLSAVSVLVSEFNRYLNGGHPNPLSDFVGYRQFPLWLSREEVVGLVSTLTPYLRTLAGNEPNPVRRAYLFSPIFFPLEEEAPAAPGPGSAPRKKPTTRP